MRHVADDTVPGGRQRPLSEPVFWILLSLSGRPRHGYALMKEVHSLSEGRVRLTTGTLYGALGRLLADKWIEPFASGDTSRDKQPYRLTSIGRTRLREEAERLRHVAHAAAARLRLREV